MIFLSSTSANVTILEYFSTNLSTGWRNKYRGYRIAVSECTIFNEFKIFKRRSKAQVSGIVKKQIFQSFLQNHSWRQSRIYLFMIFLSSTSANVTILEYFSTNLSTGWRNKYRGYRIAVSECTIFNEFKIFKRRSKAQVSGIVKKQIFQSFLQNHSWRQPQHLYNLRKSFLRNNFYTRQNEDHLPRHLFFQVVYKKLILLFIEKESPHCKIRSFCLCFFLSSVWTCISFCELHLAIDVNFNFHQILLQ